MGEVKALFGGPIGLPQVNDVCVNELRRLLQKAESGEIIGCVVAVIHHDGCASKSIAGTVGGYSVIGALESAKAYVLELNRD